MPRIISGTLTASTVATVTLDAAYSYVEVVNVSGSAPIYFAVNIGASNPTVAGNDCEVVVGVGGRTTVASPGNGVSTVKLISSGVPTYTVAGRGYDEA